MGALSKAPHQSKETILKKIENRLRKSADTIGPDADKYISYIMKEFKDRMTTDTNSVAVKDTKNISKNDETKSEISILRTEAKEAQAGAKIDTETKQEIIKDIADKIQNLAKRFMKRAKTIESKQQIFEKIKQKIMNSTKEKHIQLHNKHSELKTYSGLIAQGLEVSMQKMLDREASGRRSDNQSILKLYSEVIPVENHKPENSTKLEDDILKKTMAILNLEEISKYRELISQSLKSTSNNPRCNEIVKETCSSVQSINVIQCGEGKVTLVENLCNNITDCSNGVDEENCASQGKNVFKPRYGLLHILTY